jgi:hypothetical protein
MAAGGEGQLAGAAPAGPAPADPAPTAAISRIPLAPAVRGVDEDPDRDGRPLLIGGAVAASAISLAGAWLAWRRRTSPMARAIRAAHAFRQPVRHG